jgi:raffinose/stachyose/melibiose transport system substrate-binding protein
MAMPPRFSRRSFLGLAGAAAGAVALGGCSGDDGGTGSGSGDSTIEWWHIANIDPMLTVWANLAKNYEAAHPGVAIKITPLENEAYKARLTTVTQAGTPPDIYHTWGGGVLKQQIDAGLTKDISADVSSWIGNLTTVSVGPYQFDGKTFAVPVDQGMIGFWYNKKLFAQAKISAPPATWTEYLDAVRKLKAAGITPIALGGKDKWPGHYYWAYLAMRIGGLDALRQAGEDKNFNTPDFIGAGTRLKELVDLAPFQTGFLGAGYGNPDGQAAAVGNGKAAMELMGQWSPTVQKDASASKKGIGEDLDFFPFPEVEGGKGKGTDAFGGGGGFAVGKDAPPQAVDFLKFLLEVDNQRTAAKTGAILPVARGAEDGVTDPNQLKVVQNLAKSTGFQLYLDQAYPPAVGSQVNDSVAELIAGKASPEQVVQAITEVAKR